CTRPARRSAIAWGAPGENSPRHRLLPRTSRIVAAMMRRRSFLYGAAAAGAVAMLPRRAMAAVTPKEIYAEIEKRHAEALARLQEWVRQPSIAAESRGMTEGRDL